MRWNFTALEEPGLAIFFFGARGILPDGGDCSVLDKRLKPRGGQVYDQYTKSDLSSLQIAYFRRRWPEERAFHLSNLRRAPGFELLAQGADPLPDVKDATPPYRIRLAKRKTGVDFYINDLLVVSCKAGDPAPRPAWPGARAVSASARWRRWWRPIRILKCSNFSPAFLLPTAATRRDAGARSRLPGCWCSREEKVDLLRFQFQHGDRQGWQVAGEMRPKARDLVPRPARYARIADRIGVVGAGGLHDHFGAVGDDRTHAAERNRHRLRRGVVVDQLQIDAAGGAIFGRVEEQQRAPAAPAFADR